MCIWFALCLALVCIWFASFVGSKGSFISSLFSTNSLVIPNHCDRHTRVDVLTYSLRKNSSQIDVCVGMRLIREHRTGHPAYPAVQLCLTSRLWWLRFVQGTAGPLNSPLAKLRRSPDDEKCNPRSGIFNFFCRYLAIFCLCSQISFHTNWIHSSFWCAICSPQQYSRPQWFARHHQVLAMKVIPTTVFDCLIPCKCVPDWLFDVCSCAGRLQECFAAQHVLDCARNFQLSSQR